jgi:DNA repair exonuclease SbcCD ATPase subunit
MSLTLHELKQLYEALMSRYENIGMEYLAIEQKLESIKNDIETLEREGYEV